MPEFPSTKNLWVGDTYQNLGDGLWYKKIALIPIQVYRVAIYVEVSPATAHLRQLAQQGYFKDKSPAHVCQALMTGKFNRMIFARMSRNIPMSKFLSEMVKDLTPRLKGTGEEHQLKAFEDYFKPKKIVAGATMLSLWDGGSLFDGGLYGPEVTDFSRIRPEREVQSEGFARAMFNMYLDGKSVTPDIQKEWAQQILALAS